MFGQSSRGNDTLVLGGWLMGQSHVQADLRRWDGLDRTKCYIDRSAGAPPTWTLMNIPLQPGNVTHDRACLALGGGTDCQDGN